MPAPRSHPIVAFHRGEQRDSEGRTIAEVWSWDDDELEYVHDYIQWLFPLRAPSRFNPDAPVLDDEQIAAFQSDPALRAELGLLRAAAGVLRAGTVGRPRQAARPAVAALARAPTRLADAGKPQLPADHPHPHILADAGPGGRRPGVLGRWTDTLSRKASPSSAPPPTGSGAGPSANQRTDAAPIPA